MLSNILAALLFVSTPVFADMYGDCYSQTIDNYVACVGDLQYGNLYCPDLQRQAQASCDADERGRREDNPVYNQCREVGETDCDGVITGY